MFGDFEDVELGQRFEGQSDPATAAALAAMRDEAIAQRRDAARAAKKAAFDEAYDQGTLLMMAVAAAAHLSPLLALGASLQHVSCIHATGASL